MCKLRNVCESGPRVVILEKITHVHTSQLQMSSTNYSRPENFVSGNRKKKNHSVYCHRATWYYELTFYVGGERTSSPLLSGSVAREGLSHRAPKPRIGHIPCTSPRSWKCHKGRTESPRALTNHGRGVVYAVRLYNAGRGHKRLSSVGDASLHAYTAIVTSLCSCQTLYNARRGHNSQYRLGHHFKCIYNNRDLPFQSRRQTLYYSSVLRLIVPLNPV